MRGLGMLVTSNAARDTLPCGLKKLKKLKLINENPVESMKVTNKRMRSCANAHVKRVRIEYMVELRYVCLAEVLTTRKRQYIPIWTNRITPHYQGSFDCHVTYDSIPPDLLSSKVPSPKGEDRHRPVSCVTIVFEPRETIIGTL